MDYADDAPRNGRLRHDWMKRNSQIHAVDSWRRPRGPGRPQPDRLRASSTIGFPPAKFQPFVWRRFFFAGLRTTTCMLCEAQRNEPQYAGASGSRQRTCFRDQTFSLHFFTADSRLERSETACCIQPVAGCTGLQLFARSLQLCLFVSRCGPVLAEVSPAPLKIHQDMLFPARRPRFAKSTRGLSTTRRPTAKDTIPCLCLRLGTMNWMSKRKGFAVISARASCWTRMRRLLSNVTLAVGDVAQTVMSPTTRCMSKRPARRWVR